MEEIKQLCRVIEGALFAANKPLNISDILNLFDEGQQPEKQKIRQALDTLMNEYHERGVELKELATGFQFQVKSDLSPWIQRLWEEKPARYSRALLETLALVAYRQPITRGEISDVRGVVVTPNIIRTLEEREWVHIVGYRDVPGKPALFATTKKFLDDFGLKSLSELPPLPEIQAIGQMERNLREQLTLEEEQVKVQSTMAVMTEDKLDEMIEEFEQDATEEAKIFDSIDQLNKTIQKQFPAPKPVEEQPAEITQNSEQTAGSTGEPVEEKTE